MPTTITTTTTTATTITTTVTVNNDNQFKFCFALLPFGLPKIIEIKQCPVFTSVKGFDKNNFFLSKKCLFPKCHKQNLEKHSNVTLKFGILIR